MLHRWTADQLLKRTIHIGECLKWTGAKCSSGYGNCRHGGKTIATHRLMWTLIHGKIPRGLHVLHNCDTRSCLNIAHMFLGTNTDNMKDRHRKGRYADRCKLDAQSVKEIRRKYSEGHGSMKAIGREYGVVAATVFRAVHYINWGHVA